MGLLCGFCAWDPIGSTLERWIAKDTASWLTAAACIVMGAHNSLTLSVFITFTTLGNVHGCKGPSVTALDMTWAGFLSIESLLRVWLLKSCFYGTGSGAAAAPRSQ